MGERAIINRVKKLQELEEQKKAIEQQMEELKDQIKKDMEKKGLEEVQAGSFLIRWKKIVSNRFDSKRFAKEHERLYKQYMKESESRRFTIA